MARGSEKFAFARYPGVDRRCAACDRALRVVDVARIHNLVTAGKVTTRFYCCEHMHEGYAP